MTKTHHHEHMEYYDKNYYMLLSIILKCTPFDANSFMQRKMYTLRVCYIENNKWARVEMEFLFECLTR